jgi:hypothetical protein
MKFDNINIDDFITSVNNFSGNKLKNTEDLFRILEIVKNENLYSQLDKILFSAKAFNGLMRIIKNIDNKFDEIYFEKLRKEIQEHILIITEGLKEISQKGSNFFNEIMTEKYFLMKTECLTNLSNLTNDLEYVKEYFNDNK